MTTKLSGTMSKVRPPEKSVTIGQETEGQINRGEKMISLSLTQARQNCVKMNINACTIRNHLHHICQYECIFICSSCRYDSSQSSRPISNGSL